MNNKLGGEKWKQFLWIREGESGGNREGYSPDVFADMSELELEEAKKLLIADDRAGDVFALEGLTYADPKTAEVIIDGYINQPAINVRKKMHVYALKDFLTQTFMYSESTLDLLSHFDESIRINAVSKLRMLAKILPRQAQLKIAEYIATSDSSSDIVRMSELLRLSTGDPRLTMLSFECAKASSEENRRAVLRAHQLI